MTQTEQRRGTGGLLLAAGVVLLGVNLRTAFASVPPLIDELRGDLGLSATAAGLLSTGPILCLGLAAPLAPALLRRVHAERLLAVCAAITAAGMALRGAGGVVALYGGTLVAGVAVALIQTAVPALVRSRFPGHTGPVTGAFSMALTLGAAIAAASTVPIEKALGSGWEAALAAWALFAAVAALAWVPAAIRPGEAVGAERGPSLVREPLAWAVGLFFGVQSAAFFAGLSWVPSILEDDGRSAGSAGALLGLASLVQVAPAFVVPVIAARRPRQTPILVAIVAVSLIAVVGLLAAPGVAPLWMVLLGLGQGGALGLAMILPVLRAARPEVVATLAAMTLCIGYVIASMAPWIVGAAHDLTGGWDWPLVVLAAITLLELPVGLRAMGGTVDGNANGAPR